MTNSEPDYMSIANFLDDNWDAFVSFYGDDETGAQEQVDALREKAESSPSALRGKQHHLVWTRWTEEQRPTISGFYYVRFAKTSNFPVYQFDIRRDGKVYCRGARAPFSPIDNFTYWAGPIPEPAEAHGIKL